MMREKSVLVGWIFIVAPLCMILAGCGSGNSLKSKYDQIELGMTTTEVGAIMGRKPDMHVPKKFGMPIEQMQWHSGNGEDMWIISIGIDDGKVVYKELAKGEERLEMEKLNQK